MYAVNTTAHINAFLTTTAHINAFLTTTAHINAFLTTAAHINAFLTTTAHINAFLTSLHFFWHEHLPLHPFTQLWNEPKSPKQKEGVTKEALTCLMADANPNPLV